jgi:hypothetical protein
MLVYVRPSNEALLSALVPGAQDQHGCPSPPFHRARYASKNGTWPLSPRFSEAARCASTKDARLSRLYPCFFQHLSRIRSLRLGYFLRRSFGHDLTASIAAFRAEVNDPIRVLDDIEIMFDHDHGVTGFD